MRRQRSTNMKRNKERRERYATDPVYRQEAIEAARRYARSRRNICREDCSKNLANLSKFGTRCPVIVAGKQRRMFTFTVVQLAKVLERHPKIIERWIRNKMLRAPIFKTTNDMLVYTLDEVKAIVIVYSDHQKEVAYYRKSHEHTRLRMHKSITMVRERMGV